MIEFFTIFLIFLTLVISVLIKNTDDAVLEFHKKFEIDFEVILNSIKEIKCNLRNLNKIVKTLREFKGFKVYKLVLKIIDVLNIMLLFYPAKNKVSMVKRFFSVKFLRQAFSLYKNLTA